MIQKTKTMGDAAEERLMSSQPESVHSLSRRDLHAGHDVKDHADDYHQEHAHAESIAWTDICRIVFVALCAAAVWFRVWEPWARLSVIGLIGSIVGGWPIVSEAWEHVRDRRMTMELSMTIALIAALVIGEFFTALVITVFVLAAEVLEGLTVGRGRRAIRDLLDFLPSTTTVQRNGIAFEVPLTEVTVGDTILVAPGARIPVDGTVQSGHSYVDQATITGESMPIEKRVGAPVYAGTINQSGALELVTERLGRDTSFGKIIEAVEQAERSRAPVQKTADRYAGYLVYFALGCAVLTFALTRDARSTISVIIVAGACGIAAGTPLAVLGAIGRAAHEGAIIKGGRYLEALWAVDTVAFDKTGTLTVGLPQVREVRPVEGITQQAVLEVAAIAERRSEHPLAKAIVRSADACGLPVIQPDTFEYTPGRGILARICGDDILVGNGAFFAEHGMLDRRSPAVPLPRDASEVLVARSGRLLGTIVIADALRPESFAALRTLRRMGIRSVLLTGDALPVAEAIAEELFFLDDVHAGLLPEQKVAVIQRLRRNGHTVAMVGDGINDAPALVQATVGVAMGSGTDVARESADIVLLGNDLSKFVGTVQIARRARAIIRFNFVGTLAVDTIGVGLAAFGFLNPLIAAFIHVASELTFILNSARLLPAMSGAVSSPATQGGAPPHAL